MLFRIRRPSEASAIVDDDPDIRAVAQDVAEAPTGDPIPFRQKAQSTGQDSRAERLVLGVRSELGELRETLTGLRSRADDAFALDLEAVLADPALAETVPPRLFVDQLLAQRDRIVELQRESATAADRLESLRRENQDLNVRLAVAETRRETLADVIAALHGNLEDLRAMRASAPLPQIDAPHNEL